MSEKQQPEVNPGSKELYPSGYPGQGGPATAPQQPGAYPQVPGGAPYQPGPGGAPYQPGPGGAPYPPGQGGVPYPQGPGSYPAGAYPGEAIAMQPTAGGGPAPAGWAPAPGAPGAPGMRPPNCPPGLEYLMSVDQLLVKQKMEAIEAFTGFETNNKYEVLNSMGQRVYLAVEDTCCCTRNCCGASRPFDMKVMDNQRKEIMHLSRPLRCSTCWCPCCLQKLTVEAPKGSVIGYARQAWSCCHPKYKINNAEDETQLRVKGPCCRCNICGDIEFEVTTPDESTHVGQITKQWSGLGKEIFTDADNFGVTFPLDLDVKTKGTLLGAIFLIDFMYFENTGDDVKKEAKQLTK